MDLKESPRGRAPGTRTGALAAFGSPSLLDHQVGRLKPCEATPLLDDPAAHAHRFTGEAVLIDAAVEFVRVFDDHYSAVVGIDGQPELFRVLQRRDTVLAARARVLPMTVRESFPLGRRLVGESMAFGLEAGST